MALYELTTPDGKTETVEADFLKDSGTSYLFFDAADPGEKHPILVAAYPLYRVHRVTLITDDTDIYGD